MTDEENYAEFCRAMRNRYGITEPMAPEEDTDD